MLVDMQRMGEERWSCPFWVHTGCPEPSPLIGSYYPDRNQPSCPIISMWQSSQLRSLVANQIFYYIIFQFQSFPQLGSQVVYFPKFSSTVWLTICLDGLTYQTLTWEPTYIRPKDTIQLWFMAPEGLWNHRSLNRWTPCWIYERTTSPELLGVLHHLLGECKLCSPEKFHCLPFSDD